eukprot:TRINITY_DN25280_c0_g2_i1.p1 TRINITY_DN25280_c0_g2~~TRINITY_DN25280_c0_g2_i1.p1  ORF type:complete len:630 (-),score=148.37 TRINITY_DN25280_c0_g2_i1:214-2103(-)
MEVPCWEGTEAQSFQQEQVWASVQVRNTFIEVVCQRAEEVGNEGQGSHESSPDYSSHCVRRNSSAPPSPVRARRTGNANARFLQPGGPACFKPESNLGENVSKAEAADDSGSTRTDITSLVSSRHGSNSAESNEACSRRESDSSKTQEAQTYFSATVPAMSFDEAQPWSLAGTPEPPAWSPPFDVMDVGRCWGNEYMNQHFYGSMAFATPPAPYGGYSSQPVWSVGATPVMSMDAAPYSGRPTLGTEPANQSSGVGNVFGNEQGWHVAGCFDSNQDCKVEESTKAVVDTSPKVIDAETALGGDFGSFSTAATAKPEEAMGRIEPMMSPQDDAPLRSRQWFQQQSRHQKEQQQQSQWTRKANKLPQFQSQPQQEQEQDQQLQQQQQQQQQHGQGQQQLQQVQQQQQQQQQKQMQMQMQMQMQHQQQDELQQHQRPKQRQRRQQIQAQPVQPSPQHSLVQQVQPFVVMPDKSSVAGSCAGNTIGGSGGGPKRTDYAKKAEGGFLSEGTEAVPITTMMLRHIPCRKSQEDVMAHVDRCGFGGRYDFLYLPSDKRCGANLGYAFVNFLTPADASRFESEMSGYSFPGCSSAKACEVVPAHVQGLSQNLATFRRTEVMRSVRKPFFLAMSHTNS